jgi:hypothetical protein
LLPRELQKVPGDIGELAYKDIHNDVVCQVLGRVGEDRDGSRSRVIAVLAPQSFHETWEKRQLGKIQRSPESIGALVELLANDVQSAFTRLSNNAILSLACHLRESSPAQSCE